MRKELALVVMLAIVVAHAIPAIAQTDVETGETTFVAQAKDKAKDKAKNKDIEKEKGKKGKDKAKSKGKKDKDKGEETDLPTSGGVSGSYVAGFTLGAGALLVGGVLLARGLFRRTAPAEGHPTDENREGAGSRDGD